MKKTLLIVGVLSLFFVSCKKDFVCECTANANGVTSSATVNIKDTKKNAEELCEEAKVSMESTAGSGTASCTLN